LPAHTPDRDIGFDSTHFQHLRISSLAFLRVGMGKQLLRQRVRAWLKRHLPEGLHANMHIYWLHAMLDKSQNVVNICLTTFSNLFSIII